MKQKVLVLLVLILSVGLLMSGCFSDKETPSNDAQQREEQQEVLHQIEFLCLAPAFQKKLLSFRQKTDKPALLHPPEVSRPHKQTADEIQGGCLLFAVMV